MKELTPELIKSLTPEQMELLVELGDMAKKEAELAYQIEAVRRQEEKVGLTRNSHQSRAVHEDSEFVDLLSLKAIRERTMIRDKISGILHSLIDAGLGDLGIVKRQAANYGIGQS
jgi:hypothetical protein